MLSVSGNISLRFEKQVKSNVQNRFKAVNPRVSFQTRKIPPSIYNDAVPITHQSMVVYHYVCRSDCRYVDRTSPRLQDRINQHIPKLIRKKIQPKFFPNVLQNYYFTESTRLIQLLVYT